MDASLRSKLLVVAMHLLPWVIQNCVKRPAQAIAQLVKARTMRLVAALTAGITIMPRWITPLQQMAQRHQSAGEMLPRIQLAA